MNDSGLEKKEEVKVGKKWKFIEIKAEVIG